MKFSSLLFLFQLLWIATSAQWSTDELVGDLRWRNIGPANMMGRIAAIEALDTDYRTVLVGTASGGVFKSTNAGITWEAIFDRYGSGSIGAVAFFQPNPDIIWVGTGEAANRNSSAWGDGIYKSIDGGKNFVNMGLQNTHQIAEIAVHPTNPNIVYVAAVGHLWGFSGDRGLYKSTDGGRSWNKLTKGLPIDEKTGCTEIIMHPNNPDILFAGFYERLRQPASFYSGGPNGGLFKSTDAGKTWKKITKGLAEGSSGMIDVSIHVANPDIMVMAYEADENIDESLPGSGVYRSDDGGESWNFLLKHAVRPFYHGQIQIDPLDPDLIYVVSREFRISRDGGKTFERPRWRKDGGDDHDMWIAPYDNKIMYLATDQGARLSIDGGRHFFSFNNMAIGQYYAIGVDMRDPYYVIGGLQDNGIWMGPSNSRERRGILNEHNTWVAEGDGFHSQVDPENWRTVYTVNHVGFVARQNIETREHTYITPTPETILNFKDYFDPDFPESRNRYTIDPGEHWFFGERIDRPLLPPQFRFNWSSPFVLSPNHPKTVYFGSNHLFKSTDRGDTWRIVSPDLTTNDPNLRNTSNGGGLTNSNTGGENHFTIITIAESPLNDAVVWAGTDDGNIQVTRDGGISWENVVNNIPNRPTNAWVSRVEPSHFDEATLYVTLDNHRRDDNRPYVYKTTDFGKSWKSITSDLPEKYSVYVIVEDAIRKGLLFVGTELGVYCSVDDGDRWYPMKNNLPSVAIHDLVIHPRDGDLVAGTHGRSIWIMDDISPLRQLPLITDRTNIHLFDQRMATEWIEINTGRKQPAFEFRGENPPEGAIINFYIGQADADTAEVIISTRDGGSSRVLRKAVHTGINRLIWDLRFDINDGMIEQYKNDLMNTARALDERVRNNEHRTLLERISGQLLQASDLRSLHRLRKVMVTELGGYAFGAPFFTEKLTAKKATPGTYDISVTLGTESSYGLVTLRHDPIIGR